MVFVIMGSFAFKLAGKLPSVCQKITQVSSFVPILSSKRSISSKDFKDPTVKKIPPFPYTEKNYTVWRSLIDRTTDRLDENSKIIVVDGAVAAGKSAFAKKLAEDLDMHYIPEANMDSYYINPYGYDMRQLDPELPVKCQSFDKKKFCLDPYHINVASLQMDLLRLKFAQYVDAIAHVLNTGQGVVMDKSIYSDFVYIEAMAKVGFISKSARSVYYEVKRHVIDELLRPHLAIYLDMPVAKVMEKIKKRGVPYEQNSKVHIPEFFEALEVNYKRNYLKEISEHAELLIYDWSDGGDAEVVVEDIERIDFDKYTTYDDKMKDWRHHKEQAWSDTRMKYTNTKEELMAFFNVPCLDCPELVVSGSELEIFQRAWFNAPGMKYEEGYNAELGDKNILFKIRKQKKDLFSQSQ